MSPNSMKDNARTKVFVLDTNVILHDSACIYQFKEHDVVIPITVIEELDQFKKGKETLNIQAREFLRALDTLSSEKIFNGGIPIGSSHGKIIVSLEKALHPHLVANFKQDNPDHHILNCAYHMACDQPRRQIILVTKDVNLRLKAKSVGLAADDYTSDHVKNLSGLYAGRRIEENISETVINRLYVHPFEVDPGMMELQNPLQPNEYLVMRNGKKSALGTYNPNTGKIRRIEKLFCYGILPRNAEQAFALDALANPDIPLVTITGKAGTGKTLLALSAALEKRKRYRQIFVARPTVPLSNKDTGYLPGDIYSKLDPYTQPLFDNLAVIQNQFLEKSPKNRKIKEMLEEEKIVITPLSYIRGRSLVNVFFIVDEAQNLTPHEVKTIITRAGEGTKVVLTGDIFQIDHPYLDAQSNGLSCLIEKMKGQKLYAHVNLAKGERSGLSNLASEVLQGM